MSALEWWFVGFTVAFLAAAVLMVVIVVGARREYQRTELPEVETEPRERRGAWSRMVCRNKRTNRLGRWVQINKVLR